MGTKLDENNMLIEGGGNPLSSHVIKVDDKTFDKVGNMFIQDPHSFNIAGGHAPYDWYDNYNNYGLSYLKGVDNDLRRAIAQTGGEQAAHMFGRMATDIIGMTIQGFGSIPAMIEQSWDKIIGEEEEWGNVLTELGQDIQDAGREAMPIYREHPNEHFALDDPGWWAENAVSLASSFGLMIPGLAGVKTLSLLSKLKFLQNAGKVGKLIQAVEQNPAMKGWLKSAVSGTIMRNGENFMEATQSYAMVHDKVLNKFRNDVEFAKWLETNEGQRIAHVLQEKDIPVDKENVAKHMAGEAAWTTYKIDAANVIFDVMQMHALYKAGRARYRANPLRGHEADVIDANRVASGVSKMSKAQRVGRKLRYNALGENLVYETIGEGIEEWVNAFAQNEANYQARKILDELTAEEKRKEPNSTLLSRAQEYLTSPEALEQAFWGAAGGLLFGAGMRVMNKNEQNIQTKEDKILEINTRETKLKELNTKLDDLEKGINPYTGAKLTSKDDVNAIRQNIVDDTFRDLAKNAIKAGTLDLLEKWLKAEKVQGMLKNIGKTAAEANTKTEEGSFYLPEGVSKFTNRAIYNLKEFGQKQILSRFKSKKPKRVEKTEVDELADLDEVETTADLISPDRFKQVIDEVKRDYIPILNKVQKVTDNYGTAKFVADNAYDYLLQSRNAEQDATSFDKEFDKIFELDVNKKHMRKNIYARRKLEEESLKHAVHQIKTAIDAKEAKIEQEFKEKKITKAQYKQEKQAIEDSRNEVKSYIKEQGFLPKAETNNDLTSFEDIHDAKVGKLMNTQGFETYGDIDAITAKAKAHIARLNSNILLARHQQMLNHGFVKSIDDDIVETVENEKKKLKETIDNAKSEEELHKLIYDAFHGIHRGDMASEIPPYLLSYAEELVNKKLKQLNSDKTFASMAEEIKKELEQATEQQSENIEPEEVEDNLSLDEFKTKYLNEIKEAIEEITIIINEYTNKFAFSNESNLANYFPSEFNKLLSDAEKVKTLTDKLASLQQELRNLENEVQNLTSDNEKTAIGNKVNQLIESTLQAIKQINILEQNINKLYAEIQQQYDELAEPNLSIKDELNTLIVENLKLFEYVSKHATKETIAELQAKLDAIEELAQTYKELKEKQETEDLTEEETKELNLNMNMVLKQSKDIALELSDMLKQAAKVIKEAESEGGMETIVEIGEEVIPVEVSHISDEVPPEVDPMDEFNKLAAQEIKDFNYSFYALTPVESREIIKQLIDYLPEDVRKQIFELSKQKGQNIISIMKALGYDILSYDLKEIPKANFKNAISELKDKDDVRNDKAVIMYLLSYSIYATPVITRNIGNWTFTDILNMPDTIEYGVFVPTDTLFDRVTNSLSAFRNRTNYSEIANNYINVYSVAKKHLRNGKATEFLSDGTLTRIKDAKVIAQIKHLAKIYKGQQINHKLAIDTPAFKQNLAKANSHPQVQALLSKTVFTDIFSVVSKSYNKVKDTKGMTKEIYMQLVDISLGYLPLQLNDKESGKFTGIKFAPPSLSVNTAKFTNKVMGILLNLQQADKLTIPNVIRMVTAAKMEYIENNDNIEDAIFDFDIHNILARSNNFKEVQQSIAQWFSLNYNTGTQQTNILRAIRDVIASNDGVSIYEVNNFAIDAMVNMGGLNLSPTQTTDIADVLSQESINAIQYISANSKELELNSIAFQDKSGNTIIVENKNKTKLSPGFYTFVTDPLTGEKMLLKLNSKNIGNTNEDTRNVIINTIQRYLEQQIQHLNNPAERTNRKDEFWNTMKYYVKQVYANKNVKLDGFGTYTEFDTLFALQYKNDKGHTIQVKIKHTPTGIKIVETNLDTNNKTSFVIQQGDKSTSELISEVLNNNMIVTTALNNIQLEPSSYVAKEERTVKTIIKDMVKRGDLVTNLVPIKDDNGKVLTVRNISSDSYFANNTTVYTDVKSLTYQGNAVTMSDDYYAHKVSNKVKKEVKPKTNQSKPKPKPSPSPTGDIQFTETMPNIQSLVAEFNNAYIKFFNKSLFARKYLSSAKIKNVMNELMNNEYTIDDLLRMFYDDKHYQLLSQFISDEVAATPVRIIKSNKHSASFAYDNNGKKEFRFTTGLFNLPNKALHIAFGQLIVHELIHSAKFNTKEQTLLESKLKPIQEYLSKHSDKLEAMAKQLGLTPALISRFANNDVTAEELITYAITNPEVAILLNHVRSPFNKSKSLLSEIINKILDVLGINFNFDVNADSILADILVAGHEAKLFSKRRPPVGEGGSTTSQTSANPTATTNTSSSVSTGTTNTQTTNIKSMRDIGDIANEFGNFEVDNNYC